MSRAYGNGESQKLVAKAKRMIASQHRTTALDGYPSLNPFVSLSEELLDELPQRIAELEAASKWISVKDRLPMLEEQVLVWHSGKLEIRMGVLLEENPTHEDTFTPFKYWDDYYQDGQCWDWQDIAHWMPLPYTPIRVTNPTRNRGE